MSKNKITVEKNDYSRILLTETLPYEVPIFFSNERLYQFSKAEKKLFPPLIKRIFSDSYEYTISFDYQIIQGAAKLRNLSVVHPALQLQFPNFYRDYESLILSLCCKSAYSIRYPSRVASHYFEREYEADHRALKSGVVDKEPDEFSVDCKYAGSFFYYAKYNQFYKFIDSPEFLSLEQRFSFQLKCDIKRCFPSIYTHSISWAVKGKLFAKLKQNRKHSFNEKFDELMRLANYGETNGIVIGPEFSRIFAEIILQQIDLNIGNRIRTSLCIDECNFAIRRYMDDYFVFCRSEDLAKQIFDIVQEELKEYKLYINESKTQRYVAPFATVQTIAKSDVGEVLSGTVLYWFDAAKKLCAEDEEVGNELREKRQLRLPYKIATKIIIDLKIAVKRGDATFDVVTGYALSSITKSVFRLEKASRKRGFRSHDFELLQHILSIGIEVVFFLYAMDFRVRTTYLVSQFMLIVSKLGKADSELNGFLTAKLLKGANTVLQSRLPAFGGIEVLNLLIAMKAIAPNELLTVEELVQITQEKPTTGQSSSGSANYNYFDFVVLLHYIGNSPSHGAFREELQTQIIKKFESGPKDIRCDAQLTLLFFDMMTCPYLSQSAKQSIVIAYTEKALNVKPSASEIGYVINYAKDHLSFSDWNADLDLEKLLNRKQLNPGY